MHFSVTKVEWMLRVEDTMLGVYEPFTKAVNILQSIACRIIEENVQGGERITIVFVLD